MSYVQEVEMFGALTENFRLAAEHCEALAVLPVRGPTYRLLMDELKICETCCRQVSKERGDARWLQIGLNMEEAHKRAGTWLRKYVAIGHDRGVAHQLFLKLAECLRYGQRDAENMRTAATERLGAVLPKPQSAPLRDTRPVHITRPSGLILPATMH